jgi:DNA-binding LacI/PurR family transcriptional regulator
MVPTILDVARKAKVSAGTVSRVLNRHPSVSQENQERVLTAVQKLKYRPKQRKATMADVNPLERKNVLVMLLGMDRSLARLPVVANALHGVEAALAAARANLLVVDLPQLDGVPSVLDGNRIDAVSLTGALQGDMAHAASQQLLERLRKVPAVWVLGRPEGFSGDVVQVNDTLVGKIAAEHLVQHGHRHLAFISAKPDQVTLMRRQASFTFYAQRAGASVQAILGHSGRWSLPLHAVDQVEMVEGLAERLMAMRQRPTAVFAPDDSMGAMVYRALTRRGLAVGKDLSLISCNNETPLHIGLYPAPTTIDVHADEIGRRAVDQLAWRIAHPSAPAMDTGIEPTLVPGASVVRVQASAGNGTKSK